MDFGCSKIALHIADLAEARADPRLFDGRQIKAGTALIPIKRRRIFLLHKIDETSSEQQIGFTQTSGQQLVSLPQILFGLTKLFQSGVSTRRQYQPITLMPGRCTAEIRQLLFKQRHSFRWLRQRRSPGFVEGVRRIGRTGVKQPHG